MAPRPHWFILPLVVGAVGCSQSKSSGPAEPPPSPPVSDSQVPAADLAQLGKSIFFDTNLSEPPGQSCAVCHAAETGWTGPSEDINRGGGVYEGAVKGRFGARKPPSIAYLGTAPVLHQDKPSQPDFVGGAFWDGRATGERLGSPLAEQAQGPFLNPLEQNNPDAATVVAKVCAAAYADQFKQAFGDVCGDTQKAYDDIAQAIAAFEASSEVSAFSSKYDAYLAKRVDLTAQEKHGLQLFEGKARCSACHPSQPGPKGEPPLFADFTYDNLGTPRNPDNPFYGETSANPLGAAWVDPGLGGFLRGRADWKGFARANLGRFRVPTLRNVDKRPRPDFVKAYGHNGVFKSLKEVVHFYNTRDTLALCTPGSQEVSGRDCWPEPEQGLNVNTQELGDLGMSDEEEDALVAFLQTLSDGFQP